MIKFFYIYKRWNFLILLNNLVCSGFLVYKKKIMFLHFDLNKFFFWVYSKKVKLQTKRILKLVSFF